MGIKACLPCKHLCARTASKTNKICFMYCIVTNYAYSRRKFVSLLPVKDEVNIVR